jgi:hypothetical protein
MKDVGGVNSGSFSHRDAIRDFEHYSRACFNRGWCAAQEMGRGNRADASRGRRISSSSRGLPGCPNLTDGRNRRQPIRNGVLGTNSRPEIRAKRIEGKMFRERPEIEASEKITRRQSISGRSRNVFPSILFSKSHRSTDAAPNANGTIWI